MSEHYDIAVNGPIPLGIAGALMSMFGAVWPEGGIVADDSQRPSKHQGIVFRIPGATPAVPLDAETAHQVRTDADAADSDGANEATITDISEDGFRGQLPEDLSKTLGQLVIALFRSYEDANYLSIPVTYRPEDGGNWERYEIVVQHRGRATPHEKREEAEARVVELESELAALRGEVEAYRSPRT